MENLSINAKTLIINLMREGFSPKQIKDAMEDGAFLSVACISQDVSEEVHFWLRSLGV